MKFVRSFVKQVNPRMTINPKRKYEFFEHYVSVHLVNK